MSKKVYTVSVFFDLHGVSCPGVWLCPKGKILVKVSLFGVSEVTKQVSPSFPMRFNERFHFQKTYRSAHSLFDLHIRLRNALVKLELMQYPLARSDVVVLAVFCSPLSDILYPCPDLKPFETSADVDLLFCPTKIFPGIIAPKAEVSTKIVVKEFQETARGKKMNPTTIPSQKCKKRLGKNDKIIRQKGVCHTEYNLHCKCYNRPESCCYLKSSIPTNESVRPQKGWPLKRTKSALSVSSQGVSFNSNNKFTSENEVLLTKSKSQEEIAIVQESSDEYDRKRFHEDQDRKPCNCWKRNIGTQSKVQFRNFTLPQLEDAEKEKDKEREKLQFIEDKKTSSKCSLCSKYEDYFIHRALEHSRGALLNKSAEKVSTDNLASSHTESPEFGSSKCFCTKEKKDYISKDQEGDNGVFRGKEMQIKREESNIDSTKDVDVITDNCYVCKCPITGTRSVNTDNKKYFVEKEKNIRDRCPMCKCPVIEGKTNNDGLGFNTIREEFYNELDKYCALLTSNNNKQKTSHRSRARLFTRNPSTLRRKQFQKKWNYKEVNKEGAGCWEIAASDFNKM